VDGDRACERGCKITNKHPTDAKPKKPKPQTHTNINQNKHNTKKRKMHNARRIAHLPNKVARCIAKSLSEENGKEENRKRQKKETATNKVNLQSPTMILFPPFFLLFDNRVKKKRGRFF
jgi:hypothetical protein